MESSPEIRFLVMRSGEIESLSIAEAKTLIGTLATEPDVPTTLPLYGAPRTLIVQNFQGWPLFIGPGCYLQVVKIDGKPGDTFVRRGINLPFTPIAGVARLKEGYQSTRDGMDEPVMPRPAPGYVQDYFEGDKRTYWYQGTGTDRIYTAPVVDTRPPVVIPDKPIDNNPPVVTDPPKVDAIRPGYVAFDFTSFRPKKNFLSKNLEGKATQCFHPSNSDLVLPEIANIMPNGMSGIRNARTDNSPRGDGNQIDRAWYSNVEEYLLYPGIVALYRFYQPWGERPDKNDYTKDPTYNGRSQFYRKPVSITA